MVTASERHGAEAVSRSVDMLFESNRLRPTIYAEHLPLLEPSSREGPGYRTRRVTGQIRRSELAASAGQAIVLLDRSPSQPG